MMRLGMRWIALLLVTALIGEGYAKNAKNMLVIILDDLGYNELGYMNTSRHLVTPHIDKLASESVRFRTFISGPICSPSRSMHMTGRYTIRIGTQSNVIFWNNAWAPSLADAYMPEMLSSVFPHRGHFGKFHLGNAWIDAYPSRRGFTQSRGFISGCGDKRTHQAALCSLDVPPFPPNSTNDDDTPPAADDDMPHFLSSLSSLSSLSTSTPSTSTPSTSTPSSTSPPHRLSDTATKLHWDALGGAPGDWDADKLRAEASNTDYVGYDWFLNGEVDTSANGTYTSWLVLQDALDFLEERAKQPDQPWMLHLWLQNIHSPLQVTRQLRALYPELDHSPGLQILAAEATACDIVVGGVMDRIKKLGFDQDTITFLQSDNGAPPVPAVNGSGPEDNAVRNFPLRGFKTQTWEGGQRVPALMHFPGVLEPRDEWGLFSVTDVLPTLFHATTGKRLPLVEGANGMDGSGMNWTAQFGSGLANMYGLPIDGIDQWEALESSSPLTRKEVLYNINPLQNAGQASEPKAAVRSGDWKLLLEKWDNATQRGVGETYLFNISADMAEAHNLAKDHPEVVASLLGRIRSYSHAMVIPQQWTQPYQGEDYWCAKCPLGTPSQPYNAWRPWVTQSPPPPPPVTKQWKALWEE